MTGTIRSLDPVDASGVITAADGVNVGFRTSEVLAYDVPLLAVGQAVSFDLEGKTRRQAVNVCVQRAAHSWNGQQRHVDITHLRYMGFQQKGTIRSYLFELFAPGHARAGFTVNTEMGLFIKHHVGIQEGPGLCLRLLAAELDSAPAAAELPFQCELTDREMLAYLASRPAPRAKGGPKPSPRMTPRYQSSEVLNRGSYSSTRRL
jgi:cold shock CspA family protein